MQGCDVIGRAKTGTGKTLAFGIPIMDKIIQYNAKHGFVVYDFILDTIFMGCSNGVFLHYVNYIDIIFIV